MRNNRAKGWRKEEEEAALYEVYKEKKARQRGEGGERGERNKEAYWHNIM